MWPGVARRWWERRAHAGGPHAACFTPHRGDDWVALDLETTGLDPARDEILSIAAIPGATNRLQLRDRLVLTVRSRSTRIGDAIRHHGLRPVDVHDGLPIREALLQLLQLLGNRPVVGYCIAFDRAMLDRPLRQCFGFGLPNRLVDVRDGYRRWCARTRPEYPGEASLEHMAEVVGIPLFDRHTALGDALTTGLLHIRLGAR